MRQIPQAAILIDTIISVVICGLGIYHMTRPDQAWRSGIIEVLCAMLLISAAYYFSQTKAMIINLIVAIPLIPLGIRHIIHGGGWKTGAIELIFVVLLITTAVIIHRSQESQSG